MQFDSVQSINKKTNNKENEPKYSIRKFCI